jgi:biopolymer transport protein TolR
MALGGFGKTGTGIYRPLAEINVTPLVDVMLVLLIIFMVTAPLLSAGLKVNLPQAKTLVRLDTREPIVVTIQKDGKIALGADEVGADELVSAIQSKLGGDDSRVIHLRGDKEVPFGDVVSVMDRLATNGLTHIAIVARSDRVSTPAPGSTGAAGNAPSSPTAPAPEPSAPVTTPTDPTAAPGGAAQP